MLQKELNIFHLRLHESPNMQQHNLTMSYNTLDYNMHIGLKRLEIRPQINSSYCCNFEHCNAMFHKKLV